MWTPDRVALCRRQRGIAATEFAVVAPLFVLLMLAVAELGWAFHQYNVLTKAVRDGARFAAAQAIPGSTGVVKVTADLITRTANVVVYGNESGSGSAVLPGLAPSAVAVSAPGSNYVQVRARYAYQPMVAASLPVNDGMPLNFLFEAASLVRGL